MKTSVLSISLWISLGLTALCRAGTTLPDAGGVDKVGAPTRSSSAPPAVALQESLKKPAWLSEASITVKGFYDSNVFLSSAQGTTSKPIANRGSFGTSITPKVDFNFVPLLGLSKDDKCIQTFSLSYAPEIVNYEAEPGEDYTAHRFSGQIAGSLAPFSYNLANNLNYIDGNRDTVQYTTLSALATVATRERREQINDKGRFSLRYDLGDWFLRPVASWCYYDMLTRQQYGAGCQGWQNYEDRYDVNGGLDVGYQLTPAFAVTTSYRYGHNYQAIFPWSGVNSSNDYQRVLGGIEGQPWKWLKLDVQCGPDFRQFGPSVQPGHDRSDTKLFVDGSATISLTSVDTLSLKVKQWEFVSSTGTASYYDVLYDLSYRRKLLSNLTGTVGFQALDWHYDIPTSRDDWEFVYSAGLQYDLNDHFSLLADYSFSRGANGIESSNCIGREFDRHVVSFGVKSKF
ncbi:MAG: outer membrane beta-barrel protein [Methylacidiphilales bacterium]|nr:outer membrane beta-barrel protein [Candidatus Methylacidiphilales bacterium]